MIYNLRSDQQDYLLNQPETGMGYQVIEAGKPGFYQREKYLVLNSEVAVEMDGKQSEYVRLVIKEGFLAAKAIAKDILLTSITVLTEKDFRNVVNENKGTKEKAATDNDLIFADGDEVFVRLSAFDDDKRIDKINKCLRAGSYTTTLDDYQKCKATKDDPIERYALPSNDTIKWTFYIQPKKTDSLQRGIVQPANGKRGGGKEIYFDRGTGKGTFIKQTAY